jgi:hypothetical protein
LRSSLCSALGYAVWARIFIYVFVFIYLWVV